MSTAETTASSDERRHRVAWRWLRKQLPVLLAIVVPSLAAVEVAAGRFEIGVDPQDSRCIPEGVVFLVDRADRSLVKGRLVAMISMGNLPWFKDGTVMVKRLVAVPGDTVEIGREHTLVNGVVVADGLDLAKRTGRSVEELERRFVVPDGFVFLLGDTRNSYDSRYYGPVDLSRVVGGASVVW